MPPDKETREFPYWRRNLRVIPPANLLASLAFGLSWPFLPLMVRGLGVETRLETWVGNMVLVFYVVSFAMNPLWGSIADHYGRKIMILRAMLGMGTFMILAAFAPSPLWFAFLLCCVAIFNGSSAAGMALIVGNTPPARIGRALALVQTGMLIGQTSGPALGALLAAYVPQTHWLYWISGAMMLTGGFLVLAFVREVKQLAPGRWRLEWIGPLRELLRFRVWARCTSRFSVRGAVGRQRHRDEPLHAQAAGGRRCRSRLRGRMGRLGRARPGHLGARGRSRMGLGTRPLRSGARTRDSVAAAAVTHIPLLFLQTPLQLVIARAAFGIGAAAMQPAIVRLIKAHAPHGMDARAISYMASFQFIAMGLAPFVAGLLGPVFGLRMYFALLIVLAASGLVLWMRSAQIRMQIV